MFEEPEWAEEAPLAAGLGPVASRPRPAAASQIKVSGPAGHGELLEALKRILVDHSAGHAARAPCVGVGVGVFACAPAAP